MASRMSGWGRSRQCADWLAQALALAARRASHGAASTRPPFAWGSSPSGALARTGAGAARPTALQPAAGQSRGFSGTGAAMAHALSTHGPTPEDDEGSAGNGELQGIPAEVCGVESLPLIKE